MHKELNEDYTTHIQCNKQVTHGVTTPEALLHFMFVIFLFLKKLKGKDMQKADQALFTNQ